MNHYIKWANRKVSLTTRILTTLPVGLILLGLVPYLLLVPLNRLDKELGFQSLYFGWPNITAGGILIAAGGFLGIWSVLTQFIYAEGTPLPMMPTHRLLVEGPFRLCRSPMTLGTLLAYAGMAVLVGSISAFCTVVVIGGLLLSYLHFVEEKELAARFGQAYEDYRAKTPFIFPRLTF
jgi:protein-S-isoprenylcysteine O-methyltransferase Ste14